MVKEAEERMASMTPEELEEYEKSIPEWKRGALTITDDPNDQPGPDEEGVFRKLKNKVKDKVVSTKFVQDIKESEKERIDFVRKEYSEFRSELKEQIETSQSPVVQGGVMVAEKLKADTAWAKAVQEMLRYDPEFNIEDLTFEAKEIFMEYYCNYLSGNVEYLKKVSSGEAAIM